MGRNHVQQDVNTFDDVLARLCVHAVHHSSLDVCRHIVESRRWSVKDYELDMTSLMSLDQMGNDLLADVPVVTNDRDGGWHISYYTVVKVEYFESG